MSAETLLRRALERDRRVVLAGLAATCGLGWIYLAHLARGMSRVEMAAVMPRMQAWGAVELLLLFLMWVVMMVAMMLPSAAPTILLFSAMVRRRRAERRPYVATEVFVIGYLLAWSAYAAAATLAQWALHSASLLSPMMVSTSGALAGGILLAAGAFQWTPLKGACLRACRSPLGWLTAEWREGTRGTLIMGLRHGSYCVGCCWALMAILFAVGVMNLLWVAALTALVLLEKVGPAGPVTSRLVGLGLAGWGGWLLVGALV